MGVKLQLLSSLKNKIHAEKKEAVKTAPYITEN